MSTVAVGIGELRTNQSWQDYERALAERDRLDRHYRITYDRGMLEIMPVGAPHERWKDLIGSLLTIFAVETGAPLTGVGNWTLRREMLSRGLEPDECYYIQNEHLVRGRLELDLERDPPPDLAIEIEVTRSALNRISIYEALGVAEIWRFDGETFTVLIRGGDDRYSEAESSLSLPTFPLAEVQRRLATFGETDQTTWLRDWRAWVRANVH